MVEGKCVQRKHLQGGLGLVPSSCWTTDPGIEKHFFGAWAEGLNAFKNQFWHAHILKWEFPTVAVVKTIKPNNYWKNNAEWNLYLANCLMNALMCIALFHDKKVLASVESKTEPINVVHWEGVSTNFFRLITKPKGNEPSHTRQNYILVTQRAKLSTVPFTIT